MADGVRGGWSGALDRFAAAGDPFVLNGVVASWTVRPWDEVLRP